MRERFRVVRKSCAENVDPEAVKPLARSILSDVSERGVEKCWGAAALHRFVFDDVEYDESVPPNFNRKPLKAAEKGGNCCDLSVLLASLFKALDFRVRLTVIPGIGATDHVFPEVFFPTGDLESLTESLNRFYTQEGDVAMFQFSFVEDEEGYWFIADPGASSYLGDVEALVEKGVVESSQFVIKDRIEL